MAVNLMILFDNNPGGVYYGGQRVTGVVRGQVTEPLKARGIKLGYKGLAKTHWSERETVHNHHHNHSNNGNTGSNTEHVTVHYGSEEIFFNTELILWGQPGFGNNSQIMPVGEFNFPFMFDLPPTVPSSFEGQHGHVRYSIQVTIDRPWRFNINSKCMLSVIGLVDLNLLPHLSQPLVAQNQKSIGLCCCVSGNMNIQIRIARGGFVGGEWLQFDADISNDSNKIIKRVEASLIQDISFQGRRNGFHGHGVMGGHHEKTKHLQKTATSLIYGDTIGPGQSRMWQNRFSVPALPPTSQHRLITVSYKLIFTAIPSGLSTRFSCQMPITIGSIPLKQVFNNFSPATLPAGPSLIPPSAPSPPGFYPDMPPPSYAECTATGEGPVDTREVEDNGGDKNSEWIGGNAALFAPTYPRYNPTAPPM